MNPAIIVWLILLWAALWGDVSAGALLGGALLAVLVVWLTRAPRPAHHVDLGRVVVLVARFCVDLCVSTIQVARAVLRRRIDVRPGVIDVDLHVHDPLVAAVVANGITLTPGTLTVELDIEQWCIAVHVLELDDPDAVVAGIRELEVRAARALRPGGAS